MTFTTASAVRRPPILVFACGREPGYVRNRLLLRGLQQNYEVVVVASTHSGYLGRFRSIFPRLLRPAAKADLVVAGFLGQPIAIVAARLLRKPVLFDAFVSVYDTLCLDRRTLSSHSPLGRIAFALDREAIRGASLTLVDTDCQRRFFAETFGDRLDRLLVHYLGADFDLCRGSVVGHGAREVIVLHYGSYLPLHGSEVIVKAAHLLRGETAIKFRLIGDGPRRAMVQDLAARLELPNVEFVDWLTSDQLNREIETASIGLGGHFADNPKARRVIAGKTFQFLASGVPTIVGDCPANREIFHPGHDVVAVPMADPAALAAAIRDLARDPARRERLGADGSRLMRERFAPERVSTDLRRAVEYALGQSRFR